MYSQIIQKFHLIVLNFISLTRVKSSTGEIIGNVKRVAPGQSVTLDTIPAMSGTYVIQGQAGVSGNYYFHIT